MLSTSAFTLLFAVWLMLGMLSIKIKPELGLTDGQLYNLTLAAVLAGSILRFHFGIWADRYGGRRVMTALILFTILPTLLVSRATTFTELLMSLLYGVAGNSFSVGIAWNAAWYPKEKQGTALGIFGAGNVGASVTKFVGPFLIAAVPSVGFFGGIVPGGWRFVPVVYAVLLVLMAPAVWFLAAARRSHLGTRPVIRRTRHADEAREGVSTAFSTQWCSARTWRCRACCRSSTTQTTGPNSPFAWG